MLVEVQYARHYLFHSGSDHLSVLFFSWTHGLALFHPVFCKLAGFLFASNPTNAMQTSLPNRTP